LRPFLSGRKKFARKRPATPTITLERGPARFGLRIRFFRISYFVFRVSDLEVKMRLTLRTLLAYLDDTLEPAETKQISQKVAESDTAQELIARIKQVTRRRRLTTPPDAVPGAKFDANVVADYLDNELNPEMLAEVEKLCLESDVHLAEIAACHQILTLVVGEPLQVPPTAKERMYALAGGRKVRATPVKQAVETGTPEEDDFPLSGTKS